MKISSIASLIGLTLAQRLEVSGTKFMYNGSEVFLNGMNQAWIDYGNDFGNSQPHTKYCALRAGLQQLKDNGGHVMRMWVHVDGQYTPEINNSGYVTATDSTDTLIPEMLKYLQTAQEMNLMVVFVLWNGADFNNAKALQTLTVDSNYQSYLTNALIPMVKGLAGQPALAGWEIFNEPEGFVNLDVPGTGCSDSSSLKGTGAGWAGSDLSMAQIQKLINWSASAIHDNDSGALVTVGSWSQDSQTDSFGLKNYYTDSCLTTAGGKSNGTLDYQQMHTYAYEGKWASSSPILNDFSAYDLNKPLVIGEFNHMNGVSQDSGTYLYEEIYNKGFGGAWGWQLNNSTDSDYLLPGMESLKGKPNVDFTFASAAPSIVNTCSSCGDTPPPSSTYTCAQQSSWGKCSESFMTGYCKTSCGTCSSTSSLASTKFLQ